MIKYLDLSRLNGRFRGAIDKRIAGVLDRGLYLNGPENEKFLVNFASYCGVSHALGLANGLDALRIMIQAAGFGPGDEIIVPANTFIATMLAISQAGATPVLVEPDEETFNIDPEKIEAAITGATKALMAVHLYGRLADVDAIRAIADRHGLTLFEDAAQAHGARHKGQRAGSFGVAAAFSFYPGKNLGCLGDGGAIVSNDGKLIERAREIANYGARKKYEHLCKGCNSRLDEIQAAVLDVKLPALDADNERRRKMAEFYAHNIKNPAIRLPQAGKPESHVWHIYAIRLKNREAFQQFMAKKGIETLIHYPVPPHRQAAYAEWNSLSFPVSEKIHREVLSLPLNPSLGQADLENIVEAVNDWRQ